MPNPMKKKNINRIRIQHIEDHNLLHQLGFIARVKKSTMSGAAKTCPQPTAGRHMFEIILYLPEHTCTQNFNCKFPSTSFRFSHFLQTTIFPVFLGPEKLTCDSYFLLMLQYESRCSTLYIDRLNATCQNAPVDILR